jgi:hypothetical protein
MSKGRRYTAIDENFFALELARAGGSVPAALAALHSDNYSSFDNLGESTLIRFLKKPCAAHMIARKAKVLNDATEAAILKRESERVEAELKNSDRAKIEEIASLISTIHKQVETWAKAPPTELRGDIIRLYERLLRIHDSRLINVLPCISDKGDLSCVMIALGLALKTELGPRAPAFMDKLQKDVGAALHDYRLKESQRSNVHRTP